MSFCYVCFIAAEHRTVINVEKTMTAYMMENQHGKSTLNELGTRTGDCKNTCLFSVSCGFDRLMISKCLIQSNE